MQIQWAIIRMSLLCVAACVWLIRKERWIDAHAWNYFYFTCPPTHNAQCKPISEFIPVEAKVLLLPDPLNANVLRKMTCIEFCVQNILYFIFHRYFGRLVRSRFMVAREKCVAY
jgi:hypothetical protein